MRLDDKNITACEHLAKMYLVEVEDCDKAMCIQVSVQTIVDARQMNNLVV